MASPTLPATEGLSKLLTAREVADILRIGTNHVYDLAKTGVLPCVHIVRAVRFRPEDVAEFLATPPKDRRV